MSTVEQRVVQSIKKRGNSVYVSLPKTMLSKLGWNRGDVLQFQTIDGSMVLTKVELPKVTLASLKK